MWELIPIAAGLTISYAVKFLDYQDIKKCTNNFDGTPKIKRIYKIGLIMPEPLGICYRILKDNEIKKL